MSDFLNCATQIWGSKPPLRRSQLRAGDIGASFRFVSCEGRSAQWRNLFGVAKGLLMLGRHWAARAILGGVLLCSAFARGAGAAEPSAETLARGQALAVSGD